MHSLLKQFLLAGCQSIAHSLESPQVANEDSPPALMAHNDWCDSIDDVPDIWANDSLSYVLLAPPISAPTLAHAIKQYQNEIRWTPKDGDELTPNKVKSMLIEIRRECLETSHGPFLRHSEGIQGFLSKSGRPGLLALPELAVEYIRAQGRDVPSLKAVITHIV